MVSVYENFLPDDYFRVIEDLLMSERLPWHFNDRIVTDSPGKHFMFTHAFMNDGQLLSPAYFEPLRPLLDLIQQKQRYIGVTRIKANLYTNQGEGIEHPAHYDIPPDSGMSDKYCIGVFHVNDCNGYTVIGEDRIRSKANQLVLFDNELHYGTTQTDTDTRVVINLNLRTRP